LLEIQVCFNDTNFPIGVGKTSIIKRYTNDCFSEGTQTTLGAMFVLKDIVKNETKYEIKVFISQ